MDKFVSKINEINELLKSANTEELAEHADSILSGLEEIENHVIEMQAYLDQLMLKSKSAKSQEEFEIIQSKIEEIKTDLPELINKLLESRRLTKDNMKNIQIENLKDNIIQPTSNN